MKNAWVVIGVIAVLLIVGAVWYSSVAAKSYNDGIVVGPHIKGPASSTVSLVEYSDFQCPACGQFEPVVAGVLKEYGDHITFEYKHFPRR
jgi:protein-disulfide isomerase